MQQQWEPEFVSLLVNNVYDGVEALVEKEYEDIKWEKISLWWALECRFKAYALLGVLSSFLYFGVY